MTTEGDQNTTTTTEPSGLEAELNTLKETSAALSKQVSTLQAQITAKDKELSKWQKKGKERDADVDNKAAEGDSAAWQKKLDDLRAELGGELENYKGKVSELEGQLKHERVKTPGIAKAAEFFNPDALPLIQLLIERHCDLQDGEIVVKDDRGEVRYSPNDSRRKMSMEEYLKELVKKHPSAAKPTGQSGTDSGTGKKTTTGTNTGTTYTAEQIFSASPAEANEMIKKGDVQTAKNFLRAISGGGK